MSGNYSQKADSIFVPFMRYVMYTASILPGLAGYVLRVLTSVAFTVLITVLKVGTFRGACVCTTG